MTLPHLPPTFLLRVEGRSRLKRKSVQLSIGLSSCVHYWEVESTGEAEASGKCRKCHEVKVFQNYVDYEAVIHQHGGAFAQSVYTPLDEWLLHEVQANGKTWTR